MCVVSNTPSLFVSILIDFTNPDFVRYAESFGAKGYRIQAADELALALNAAFEENVLAVIDCPVDFSEKWTHDGNVPMDLEAL